MNRICLFCKYWDGWDYFPVETLHSYRKHPLLGRCSVHEMVFPWNSEACSSYRLKNGKVIVKDLRRRI